MLKFASSQPIVLLGQPSVPHSTRLLVPLSKRDQLPRLSVLKVYTNESLVEQMVDPASVAAKCGKKPPTIVVELAGYGAAICDWAEIFLPSE